VEPLFVANPSPELLLLLSTLLSVFAVLPLLAAALALSADTFVLLSLFESFVLLLLFESLVEVTVALSFAMLALLSAVLWSL